MATSMEGAPLHPAHKGAQILAPEPEPATSTPQLWAAITARVLSLVLFVLTLVWLVGEAGGLEWYPGDDFFNLHAFFMLLGVGVFMTNSVVSWRDMPFKIKHGYVKMIHAGLNTVALLFIALGLYVTFKANDSPHFVTFHSWAALFGLLFLGIQVVGGFTVYLFPVMPLSWRELMLPKHAALGLATYFTLGLVSLLGIVEFLAMTTITVPLAELAAGGAPVPGPYGTPGYATQGSNQFFKAHNAREAYRDAAPMLGNVTALCLWAVMMAVGYALVPRRNVEIDLARGPLRRGHGLENAAAAGTATTGGGEMNKAGPQWPLKDAESNRPPGDINPVNDNPHANVDAKDFSAYNV